MRITKIGRLAIACLLLACAVEGIAILVLNHGTFTYTLDDAYVHLAVAESITRGVYGLDPGNPGSPSSSVVWPFLLTPLARTAVGRFLPLLLNLLAACGTLLILDRLASGLHGDGAEAEIDPRWVLVLGAIPALNLVGLAFTGMEHSLQVLAAAGCTAGLAAGALPRTRVAGSPLEGLYRWTPVWAVLGPLVRYEDLAIAVPALVLLWLWGRRRAAAVSGALLAAGLGGFSLFLRLSGQGWLPTSVLKKTEIGFPYLSGLVAQLQRNTTDRQGALLTVGLLLLAVVATDSARPTRERQLAAGGVIAVLLHMVFGRFGWFSRYEIYIASVVMVLGVFLWCRHVLRILSRWHGALLAVSAIAVVCLPYLYSLVMTPIAANNIFEQHVQMYRLATEVLDAPVAANDIGRLAYRNEHTVVDLAGLGNRDALEARLHWQGPGWMDRMAAASDAGVVMVYESWYPELPERWVKLGELRLSRARITPSNAVVSIFVRDPAAAPGVREALRRFAPTLPPGPRLLTSPDAVRRRPGAPARPGADGPGAP